MIAVLLRESASNLSIRIASKRSSSIYSPIILNVMKKKVLLAREIPT